MSTAPMRPCAFPACPNGADPRWGGYCDGHGAASPEQLIGRSVVEMGHLREQLAAMTEAAGNATDERDACEARAEKAEADLVAAKAVFADAMHRADEVDALRAEVERLRETLANNRTTCAYCEAVHPLPCTFDDIRAHIETCSKHPVAALRAKVERLREALEALVEYERRRYPPRMGGNHYPPSLAPLMEDARVALKAEVEQLREALGEPSPVARVEAVRRAIENAWLAGNARDHDNTLMDADRAMRRSVDAIMARFEEAE